MVDLTSQPVAGQNPTVPSAPAEPEDKYGWAWIPAVMFGVMLIAVLLAAFFAPTSNEGFASAAAALTIIGAVAVGIERLLEVIWSIIDNTSGGGWWPLLAVRKRILQVEHRTRVLLSVPAHAVIGALDQASAVLKSTDRMTEELAARIDKYKAVANQRLPQLGKKVDDAAKLAPGSPRLAVLREAKNEALDLYEGVLDITGRVEGLATDVRDTVTAAAAQTERLEDAIESFSDNPARRIMSVLAGATIGVGIAGFLGLNLFLAVEQSEATVDQVQQNTEQAAVPGAQVALAAPTDGGRSPLEGRTGVVLTGIITGLGASPTHEVIKVLQRRKQRNAPATATSGAQADEVIDVEERAIMGYAVRAGYSEPQPPSALARTYQRRRAIRPTE